MGKSDRVTYRNFGFGLTGLLFVLSFLRLIKHKPIAYTLYAGIIILAIALIYPILLKPVYLAMSKAGKIIGKINTAIILFMLYYFVVWPLSVILRFLKNGDSPHFSGLKIKKERLSYWVKKEYKEMSISDYERPY